MEIYSAIDIISPKLHNSIGKPIAHRGAWSGHGADRVKWVGRESRAIGGATRDRFPA